MRKRDNSGALGPPVSAGTPSGSVMSSSSRQSGQGPLHSQFRTSPQGCGGVAQSADIDHTALDQVPDGTIDQSLITGHAGDVDHTANRRGDPKTAVILDIDRGKLAAMDDQGRIGS